MGEHTKGASRPPHLRLKAEHCCTFQHSFCTTDHRTRNLDFRVLENGATKKQEWESKQLRDLTQLDPAPLRISSEWITKIQVCSFYQLSSLLNCLVEQSIGTPSEKFYWIIWVFSPNCGHSPPPPHPPPHIDEVGGVYGFVEAVEVVEDR